MHSIPLEAPLATEAKGRSTQVKSHALADKPTAGQKYWLNFLPLTNYLLWHLTLSIWPGRQSYLLSYYGSLYPQSHTTGFDLQQ